MTQTHALSTSGAASAARAPRFDMYASIHKALRRFMGDTLTRLGAMDATDAAERAAALDALEQLLALMRSHLRHENDFVHTAIEARRAGAARHTADDHLLHQDAIDGLEDEARALRDARDEQRPALALRLYRHLAEFVGENLQHMQVEETRNNTELWALYGDDELVEIHDRLVASIEPAEMALVAHWMAAALSVPELALVFADIRSKAPAPAFEALLGVAWAQLDERRRARFAQALGLEAPAATLLAVAA